MKSFSRGVKLTVQHVYTPLNDIKTAMGAAQLETAATYVPTRFQWVVPSLSSRSFETASNKLYLPFTIPPFQQDFDNTTFRPPSYNVVLDEVSMSFDQRAEPYAITDQYAPLADNFITAADMTRLDMTIALCRKTPTAIGGQESDREEVLVFNIKGNEAFASADYRANPLLVSGLHVPLDPFKTYWWEVSCPGLFKAPPADDTLKLPSFTIHCKALSPIFERDQQPAGVQNIPVNHSGQKQTWAGPTLPATPAADATINGQTDLQDAFEAIDHALSDKLQCGYDQESDAPPQESINKDSGYTVIVIPMWQGFDDLRASEVPTAGVPYIVAPWQTATCDRRLMTVPTGFVLHHAFAAWSLNAPPCPLTGGNAAWGDYPSSATFRNKVGVMLHNGLRGDNYKFQQVAYAEWTPANANLWQVDSFLPDVNSTTIPKAWTLQHLPLVSDNVGLPTTGYFKTGYPFFMGRANNKTDFRTQTGDMPADFGGAAYANPITDGCENTLEVRWSMEDTVQGLDHAAAPDDVRIGTGGHWVILVGKSTVGE